MIKGLGVDIVSPQKIKKVIDKWGKSFLDRVFNHDELKNIAVNKIYYQRIAARFAAKEAVIKALGKSYPLSFRDISISNLPSGAPVCSLSQSKGLFGIEILISITHIEDYAVATAIAQERS